MWLVFMFQNITCVCACVCVCVKARHFGQEVGIHVSSYKETCLIQVWMQDIKSYIAKNRCMCKKKHSLGQTIYILWDFVADSTQKPKTFTYQMSQTPCVSVCKAHLCLA